jgi:hypothetical protein
MQYSKMIAQEWLVDFKNDVYLRLDQQRNAVDGQVMHAHLIAHRITQARALEPHLSPQITDRTVHLERAGLRRPVDRAVLEAVEPAAPVRAPRLIGDRTPRPASGEFRHLAIGLRTDLEVGPEAMLATRTD